jgi:hypothetical protein
MKIILTPDWFTQFDVSIEIFSFIILALFFAFSLKSYRLNKNKKCLYLGIAFLLIAIGELATILTKFILFYDTTFTQNIGRMIVTYNITQSVDIFYKTGFFLHKLFTLAGLYILYKFPMKKLSSGDVLLAFFFLIISALAGQQIFHIFHIAVIILLVLIINNFYITYQKSRLENTKILIISLSILTLSHIMFMLSLKGIMYALAQIMQLVSYVILLIIIIKILKNEKNIFKYYRRK